MSLIFNGKFTQICTLSIAVTLSTIYGVKTEFESKRKFVNASDPQCFNGTTCFWEPMSDDWNLAGKMVVPLNTADADPFMIIPCPLGKPIRDCHWTSKPPVTSFHRAPNKDMFTYFMPNKLYGPNFVCPDPLLVSGYFAASYKIRLTFKWYVYNSNYIIKLCFTSVTPTIGGRPNLKFDCSTLYANSTQVQKENMATFDIPENANIIRITATYNHARRCGRNDYLQIYDINIVDMRPKIVLQDLRLLENISRNLMEYNNSANRDKCVSDVQNQLKFDEGGELRGFFPYPTFQWLVVDTSTLDATNKIFYHGHQTILPNTLLAVQLRAYTTSATLISNPVPCLIGREYGQLAKLIIEFRASANIMEIGMCLYDHVTDLAIQCETRNKMEIWSSSNNFSSLEFLIPPVSRTFEFRIHVRTNEEDGFLILKRISVDGKICESSPQCQSVTNLNTISKMTNASRVLTCPIKSSAAQECHWYAPERYKAINDRYSFVFFNDGTLSNCSAVPFMESAYFDAAPNRNISFSYSASGPDYAINVYIIGTVSISLRREKYMQLNRRRFKIRQNSVNRDLRGSLEIPDTANKVYISVSRFGHAWCSNSTVSIYDIKVE